jgi:hypothetical protein
MRCRRGTGCLRRRNSGARRKCGGRGRRAAAPLRSVRRSTRRRRARTSPAHVSVGAGRATRAHRQQQVPDQLVQECRVKSRVLRVADRAVRGTDLKAPGQRRRAAKQLLVEVVADPADRLRDEQRGSGCVHEGRDVRARRRSTHSPASVPAAMPPQIPRPPLHTANGPHQCGGTSLQLVAKKYRRPPITPAGNPHRATS